MSLFALLSSLTITGSDGIDCTFSGETWAEPVVAVTLEPVPSLKDRPGLYRVMMQIGTARVRGNAQPITTTAEPDVMIRAKAGAETYYTIGLRQDGIAAMLVSQGGDARTLTGLCQHHETWFPGWIGDTTSR